MLTSEIRDSSTLTERDLKLLKHMIPPELHAMLVEHPMCERGLIYYREGLGEEDKWQMWDAMPFTTKTDPAVVAKWQHAHTHGQVLMFHHGIDDQPIAVELVGAEVRLRRLLIAGPRIGQLLLTVFGAVDVLEAHQQRTGKYCLTYSEGRYIENQQEAVDLHNLTVQLNQLRSPTAAPTTARIREGSVGPGTGQG